MKKYLFSISLLTFHFSLFAQDIFISKGKIEFERKVNLYKNLDDQSSTDQDGGFDWAGQLKKQVPEYSYTYFNLYFDDNKTLYKPGREVTQTQKIPEWFQAPAQNNVV